MGIRRKKYPAHQIARKKKFLMTRNHRITLIILDITKTSRLS